MRHSDETQQEGYFKNAKTNQIYFYENAIGWLIFADVNICFNTCREKIRAEMTRAMEEIR